MPRWVKAASSSSCLALYRHSKAGVCHGSGLRHTSSRRPHDDIAQLKVALTS